MKRLRRAARRRSPACCVLLPAVARARSRSRKSRRRSASRPGWSRTRARPSWRCPSPSPAARPPIRPGRRASPISWRALLTDGAGPLDAQAFRQRQEDAAASLGFDASLDRLTGSLRVLSANRDEGFELLRLALTQPRFDPDMVDQRRAQTIASLNQAAQRPRLGGRPHADGRRCSPAIPMPPIPTARRRGSRPLTPDLLKKRAADAAAAQRPDRLGGRRHRRGRTGPPARPRRSACLPTGTPPALPPEWVPPTKPRTIVVERPVPQSTALMALPGIAARRSRLVRGRW